MIECRDGSIYTGITVDVAARYAVHASGKGARYTRSHPPKRLLASVEYPDRSSALKAEYEVKLLSADAKRAYADELASDERAPGSMLKISEGSILPTTELVPSAPRGGRPERRQGSMPYPALRCRASSLPDLPSGCR
jgi:putative endonuclease